jgi:chorismate mutase/prephenate dehydratase
MKLAEEVAEYKMKFALPIFDAKREKEVIEKNSQYISDDTIKEYYVRFLQNLMDESKNYQSRLIGGLKVAYSGVEGAFAHAAAIKMFPNSKYIAYADFESAYKAVENGEVDP